MATKKMTIAFTKKRRELEAIVKDCARKLGYMDLKDEQLAAVTAFVEGNDVLVSLPTGYGKSLCYYCLPSVFDALNCRSEPWSVVIVVSPLTALMNDQIESLTRKNVTSVVARGDDEYIKSGIVEGHYQIVFTSPEILLADKNWNDVFGSPSLGDRLVALVVDEAHCVKKWGKDFRKEFSKLRDLRGYFSQYVRFMALTATATMQTRKEVIRLTGMHKPVLVLKSPEKPNTFYSVEMKGELEESFYFLAEKLRSLRTKMEKTIIFCQTYNDCSQLFLFFRDVLEEEITDPIGFPDIAKFHLVDMFTACSTPKLKASILKSFSSTNSRSRVVVATVAFGMGIDCSDVRYIYHWSPPSDIETYIQETGRAGIDNNAAFATLFFSKKDLSYSFIEQSMVDYCNNNGICRRQILFKDFGLTELKVKGCECCDLCIIVCECSDCAF